jgi:hypothetical protein
MVQKSEENKLKEEYLNGDEYCECNAYLYVFSLCGVM